MDKLELLALAKKFDVQKTDKGYKIAHNECDLVAFIEDSKITYCVSGVYDSGSDNATIDMEGLVELVDFCELMTEK